VYNGRNFLKIISTIIIALVSLVIPLISGCRGPQNIDRTNAELTSLLDTRWTEYSQGRTDIAGGLAIRILSPRGDYFVSAGLDNEATENIHFRAASTTKTFTAAAILLLDQRGKLNIDDRIISNIPGTLSPYIPDTPEYGIPYKEEITISQLLGHRAGVFDVSNSPVPDTVSADYAGKNYVDYIKEDLGQIEHTFTTEELVGIVSEHHLSYFKPGGGYHYSNTGYSMLGKIIERISGMNYASFLKENLLEPNGLNDTTFPSDGNDRGIPVTYAQGFSIINGTLRETTQDNMSAHVAEGNMITTPND
jgi:D-alanyl-D-alanine carboxypeptidase